MSSDLIRSKQVRDTLVTLSRFAGKRFMLTTNGQESKDEYCAAYNSQQKKILTLSANFLRKEVEMLCLSG